MAGTGCDAETVEETGPWVPDELWAPDEPGASAAVITAITADASAAGTVIQNPYWTGCPAGAGGWNEVTGETPAEVIVADVPVVR
jgi:hypothetical protein